jgi:hypothetical protein
MTFHFQGFVYQVEQHPPFENRQRQPLPVRLDCHPFGHAVVFAFLQHRTAAVVFIPFKGLFFYYPSHSHSVVDIRCHFVPHLEFVGFPVNAHGVMDGLVGLPAIHLQGLVSKFLYLLLGASFRTPALAQHAPACTIAKAEAVNINQYHTHNDPA